MPVLENRQIEQMTQICYLYKKRKFKPCLKGDLVDDKWSVSFTNNSVNATVEVLFNGRNK